MGSTNKEMGFFSKGKVNMDVVVDRTAYAPGDTVTIVAKVNNSSSSEMTPKFSLIRDVVYRAEGNIKHDNCVIQKMAENCVKPKTQKEVKCELKIPHEITQTIHNCDIITVQYILKVYLDISFAFDPEVVFPVIICSPELVYGPQPGVAAGPPSAWPVGGPSNMNFPSPAGAMGPYPAGAFGGPSNGNFASPAVAASPYPYGQPGAQSYSAPPPAYPAKPPHVSEGYNNPVPRQPPLYGDPFTSPSSVLHPPPSAPSFHPPPSAPEMRPPPFSHTSPTAPAYNLLPSAPTMNTDFLSQSDEAPPAYSLLFPPSDTENTDAKL